MKPVYLAGPFAGDVALNVARIASLSRLAIRSGLAPVSVHAGIQSGAYGDDDDPAERERGLAAACTLAAMVADAGGYLWVILRDDGTMSPGTLREVRSVELGTMTCAMPWRDWLARGAEPVYTHDGG